MIKTRVWNGQKTVSTFVGQSVSYSISTYSISISTSAFSASGGHWYHARFVAIARTREKERHWSVLSLSVPDFSRCSKEQSPVALWSLM